MRQRFSFAEVFSGVAEFARKIERQIPVALGGVQMPVMGEHHIHTKDYDR